MKRKWYFIVVLLLLFLGGCKKNTTKFEVSFDLNYPGGTLLTREVKKGETVEKPTDPLREGYLFLDWYLDLEDEEAFDFITPITNDIILLAKWEAVLLPDQVLVIFDYQYDNKREEFIVNIGSLLDEVVPGEREGYLFEGWFYEADLFDFETAIEEEITLYAFWIKAEYTLTLPDEVTANVDVSNKVSYGEEVILTIYLEAGVTIKSLLINDVEVKTDIINENKYHFIIKEDTEVKVLYNYQLSEATIKSRSKITTDIADGDASYNLNITNDGASSLEVIFNTNSGSTKSIFNNGSLETRLYPGSGNGSALIIKVEEGYEIVEIVISTAAQNAGFSINGEGKYINTNSSKVIELIDPSESVEIKNIAEATSGNRVDIKEITIKYKVIIGDGIDIKPPLITLKEDVKTIYQFGDVWDYEEALKFVSVTDNKDKRDDLVVWLNDDELQSALIINGESIFDLEGSYEITYYSKDLAGNVGELTITIRVFETLENLLESIDYKGYGGYYNDLNQSNDVITEMAYLLRETIGYVTYGDARYLYVPFDDHHQVVLYDDPSSAAYGLVPNSWGSGGNITLNNGVSLVMDREHVWACSDMRIAPQNNSKSNKEYNPYVINSGQMDYRPSNTNRGHYSDLHNLWNSVASENRSHGDRFYGEEGGPSATPYLRNSIYYPGEEYIGDIARILFYMTLMYPHLTLVETGDKNAITGSIYYGYLDVLLYWNEIDPPSEYEISRNEMIFNLQGNRNPFVDFYEEGFAEKLFIFGDPNVLD